MPEDDPIPISLVAHAVFCPRRAWLEAAGEKVDSAQIQAGQLAHGRVDDQQQSRPGELRAVEVSHPGLGLVGRCDLIRHDSNGVRVIEYKATPVRRKAEPTAAQRVQLALQVMCLEESGAAVSGAGVYFSNHKKLVEVAVAAEDKVAARAWVGTTRKIIGATSAPEPLLDDPRCRSCSHVGVCLPDEQRVVGPYRRISVADPDGEIVHVTVPGARVSLQAGRVKVVKGDELASLPLERVRGLVLHGNVDCSSALLRELMWRRLTVVWCSGRGRVVGWSCSADSPNGLARVKQHVLSESGSLPLARGFVASKVANQATQLRRNADPAADVRQLRSLVKAVGRAQSLPEVFGLEGEAAAHYFEHFSRMLAPHLRDHWSGRSGRHASDPVNAALNYAYGLLLADCIRAVAACGLDPVAGFLHSAGRNKPALALDLMEEFRAPVADSAVLRAFNNGEVDLQSFSPTLGEMRLRDGGKRRLTAAYERRVQEEFTHPVFKYRVTWRRAMEVQARMILGFLDGTVGQYRGIRTR